MKKKNAPKKTVVPSPVKPPAPSHDELMGRLAMQAREVMGRRTWWVKPLWEADFSRSGHCILVFALCSYSPIPSNLAAERWIDPFQALVEADAWYKANVENQ